MAGIEDSSSKHRPVIWATLACLVVGLLGAYLSTASIAGTSAASSSATSSGWSTVLALCGGSAALGGLLGFLFSIPRTRTADQPAATGGNEDAAPRPKAALNTSLDQIIDWLTKIIVGVGLVEGKAICTKVWNLLVWLADNDRTLTAVYLGAAIYFLVLGFMGIYLITRLWLAPELLKADARADAAREAPRKEVRDAAVTFDAERIDPKDMTAAAQSLVETYKRVGLDDLESTREIPVWAKARLIDRDYDQAIIGYQRALGLGLDNPRTLYEYALALYLRHDVTDGAVVTRALGLLRLALVKEAVIEDDALRRDLHRFYTWLALWEQPDGYERVIRFAEGTEGVLAHRGETPEDVQLNIACAYGQRHAALQKRTPAAAAAIAETRRQAIAHLRALLQRNPAWKARVRELATPGGDKKADDNDLESLRDDPEFAALIA